MTIVHHAHEFERRFRANPHRLIPSGPKAKDFVFKAPLGVAPPPKLDVSPFMHLRDQGNQGSCVGNSTCFAVESLRNKFRPYDQDSDCAREVQYELAQKLTGNLGSDTGASLRAGLDAGIQYGFARERLFPYPAQYVPQMPSNEALADAALHRLTIYENVPLNKDAPYPDNISMVKLAMMTGRVVFGISVPRGMFAIKGPLATHPAQWNWSDPTLSQIAGAHAIACAGWDDTIYPEGYGVCILGNSWGSAYGDNGYVAVPWIQMISMAFECWVVKGFDGYAEGATPAPAADITPAQIAQYQAQLAALGLTPLSGANLCPAYEYLRRRGVSDLNIAKLAGVPAADLGAFEAANAGALSAWTKF